MNSPALSGNHGKWINNPSLRKRITAVNLSDSALETLENINFCAEQEEEIMAKGTAGKTNTAIELAASVELQNELEQVKSQLMAAADELYSPLSDLVRSQLRRTTPLVHAVIVLTAGVGAPDTAELREKRIWLAAALELLYVALHIHQMLLTKLAANSQSSPDKSWLGSIILAGDYCFSRSATLAAQTNSPEVVMIFANALKTVNEGHLRQHFTQEWSDFDENQRLFEAGAQAAATLVTQDQASITELAKWGREIATQIQDPSSIQPPSPITDPHAITPAIQVRRRALQLWLVQNYPVT
ncbi:hypothetical protein BH10CHL1_BH10CHL1_50200 [soil metagenome]